jgi:uncharacterized protein (TIGR02246 family)
MLRILSVLLLCAVSAQAAEKPKSDTESYTTEIRNSGAAFCTAFNHGNAKAIASAWTADGMLVDDQGKRFKGRKAIETEYADLFKQNPGLTIAVDIQSIEFATPTIAIEDGVAQVSDKSGNAVSACRYTAIHVLHDGKWLTASVRESRIDVPTNYPQLQSLEWLIGSWESKAADATINATFRWIADRSFLQRDYSVRRDGMLIASGVQIIGWDPATRRVRSWSFNSSGGFATGLWTATRDGWRIDCAGLMSDGTPTSSQDYVIRVPGEDNVIGWRSTHRKTGAAALPDTPETVLQRSHDKVQ